MDRSKRTRLLHVVLFVALHAPSLAIAQPLEEIRVASLGSRGVVFSGEAPHTLDEHMSRAGDVNGDGLADFLLVSNHFEADYARTVYLVYGRADLPSAPSFGELPELATTFARSTPRFRGSDLLRNVDAAGDIDRDGFDDFLIMRTYGAPDGWTGPNEIPGLVYLVYGSNELPREVPLDTATEGVRIAQFTSTKSSRTSLALDASTGGDLNGDGKSDLVLGAGFSESDDAEYEWGPGRVYVIFGGTELVGLLDVEEVGKTLPGVVIEGSVDAEWLGYSVEFAGDVDGDGVDDVLAGAPSPLGWQPGSAYLIYGGTDLPVTSTMDGLIAGNRAARLSGRGSTTSVFGTAKDAGKTLAAAGDLNGDGFTDFLIGSSGAKREAGHVYLVFGRPDLPADVELPAIERTGLGVVISGDEAGQLAGSGIATLDFSGDGWTDLVIGAFGAEYLGMHWAGITYVIPGADLEAPGPALSFVSPSSPVSMFLRQEIPLEGTYRYTPAFGRSAANAGDVNGDGRDDLLISAPSEQSEPGGPTGWVYLIYGRDGSPDPLSIESVRPAEVSVKGGDQVRIIGTGFDESTIVRIGDAPATVTAVESSARLVVEAPAATSLGPVDVVVVRDQEIARVPGGLVYVPEIYPDIDVTELAASGRGFVVSSGVRTFASSVCLVDHDGDGLHDIVTLAAYSLLVVYGRREAWTEVSVEDLLDPGAGELPAGMATIQVRAQRFGAPLGSVGDVNADGVDDFAYGDRGSATIAILLGGGRYDRESLEDLIRTGRAVEVLVGNLSPGERGFDFAGGEDFDGDAIDDLVVGIADGLDDRPGRVILLHGRRIWPDTVFLEDGPSLWHFASDDAFGASLASPGDVDGDGQVDLLVGAPGRSSRNDGNGYVISGEVLGVRDLELEVLLAAGFAFQLDAFKQRDAFGHRVAGLGDFNGDGRRDIALSAESGGLSVQGETYVVFGDPRLDGGPAAAPLSMRDLGNRGVRCLGEFGGDRADTIAPAGDFNGDGLDDLLVGAPNDLLRIGKAYVVFGGPARTIGLGSLGAGGVRLTGEVGLGYRLAGGGDFNGDGLDDVVVVAQRSSRTGAKLHVIFGESAAPRFVRGDANTNSVVDLSDPIFFLGSLFAGAGELLCEDAADGNDDGRLGVADAIFVLGHLFGGGAPIPPPFPDPGVDPTADGLTCEDGR